MLIFNLKPTSSSRQLTQNKCRREYEYSLETVPMIVLKDHESPFPSCFFFFLFGNMEGSLHVQKKCTKMKKGTYTSDIPHKYDSTLVMREKSP